MFSIICTRGQSETDFIHPKKGLVTTQNSWALVSGHVNIRTWQYWVELFARVGFQLRGDLGHTLLAALAGNPKMGTALSASWSPKNLLIVSRS